MAKRAIQATILVGTAQVGISAGATITIKDATSGANRTLWADRLAAGGAANPVTADANGQFLVYADPGRVQITVTDGVTTRIWEDVELDSELIGYDDAIFGFGFVATIDSPAAGDITIDIKQRDNATDPTPSEYVAVGFPGTAAPVKLIAADSLKLDKTDHLGLDDLDANTETFLFLYAIDRNGTLEWGISRNPEYRFATSDFVNAEGTATDRDKVFCSAAITVNDPCRVVGMLKATYNTSTPDWDSVTANTLVSGDFSMVELNGWADRIKGAVNNLGFTVAVAANDITITFLQGGNADNCTSASPARFNFWGRQDALKLEAAKTLVIDALDDFELDSYVAGAQETTLYLYAIDDGGTLRLGVGRRLDYTRANVTDFVTTGSATARNDVMCDTAPAANSPCMVIGFFKATYTAGSSVWASITSESDVAGRPPGPHPRAIAKAWIQFSLADQSIASSFNIVGVTDGAQGTNTVTLDTDFADTNFVVAASCGQSVANNAVPSPNGAGAFSIFARDVEAAAAIDDTLYQLVAFGD